MNKLTRAFALILWSAGMSMGFQVPGSDFAADLSEPYSPLHGGAFGGGLVAESPDPLASYRWSRVCAEDALQVYTLRPERVVADKPESFHNLGSLVERGQNVEITGTGSIRMDFGVESAGWLEFDSSDLNGDVEMSISEYNEPGAVNGGLGVRYPAKTAKPTKHGQTYRLELNKDLFEGVRFGWIHVRSLARPWHIQAVRLVCQVKPTNYEGSFSSDDMLLNRIWYTGAYTVKLNLGRDSFGALLMDRGDRISWTGDAHTSQAAALVAFGNWDFVRKNLEHTAPSDNGIESYSLYWVLSLVDYYRYSGDAAFFDKMASKATEKLAHGAAIWENPRVVFYGSDERLGADFENPETPETHNAYRALLVRTLREFAWALGERGRKDEQTSAAQMAQRLAEQMRSGRDWMTDFGLHAAADAIDAGIPTDEEAKQLYAREFSDPVTRLSYSPFNQYFILQAMARMAKYDDAISSIRDLWGGQIHYGGTTFFEVYEPSWDRILGANDAVPNCQTGYTSLCHAWGSGVTKWLSEEVLGIRPTAPGFSSFTVEPHLGLTLLRVAGSMPTPHGPISMDFNASTGTMQVTVPTGTACEVGIPKQGRSIREVWINGNLVNGAREDAQFLYLKNVRSGTASIRIRYDGAVPKYVESGRRYAASFAGEDRTTAGNWPGHYGKDGFVLFSHGAKDADISKLPSYVELVTPRNAQRGHWLSGGDERALPAGPELGAARAIGYLRTDFPDWDKVSMTLDINVKGDCDFQVALYFVDWDHHDRRLAVEMFDEATLKRVSPIRLVSDFGGGNYLIYRYHRSCRFRVDYIRGDAAVVSAIFFDYGKDAR